MVLSRGEFRLRDELKPIEVKHQTEINGDGEYLPYKRGRKTGSTVGRAGDAGA